MTALRIRQIAGLAALVGLSVGGAMLVPFAIDALKPAHPAQSQTPDRRDAYASRFRMEQYLVELGRDPLAWNCRPSQTIRVRYFKNVCFAEHILEFEALTSDSAATLQLTARGEAGFISPRGGKLLGQHYLDPPHSTALVSMLTRQLPQFPSHLDNWQMPMYQSAIEACISGRPYLVIRNVQSDVRFEHLARELTTLAGVKLTRTTPGTCM